MFPQSEDVCPGCFSESLKCQINYVTPALDYLTLGDMVGCVTQKCNVLGWLIYQSIKSYRFFFFLHESQKSQQLAVIFLSVWMCGVLWYIPCLNSRCAYYMCLWCVGRTILIHHCWLTSYCRQHIATENHPVLWAMRWWSSLSDKHKCVLISVGTPERCVYISHQLFFSLIIW